MANPIKAILTGGVITGFAELSDADLAGLRAILNTSSGYVYEEVSSTSATCDVPKDIFGKRLVIDYHLDSTATLPLDDGSFIPGAWFEILQLGNGSPLIKSDSSATIQSRNNYRKLAGIYASARVTYVGNNVWRLSGDLTWGSGYDTIVDLTKELTISDTANDASKDFLKVYQGVATPWDPVQDTVNGTLKIPSGANHGLILTKYGKLGASGACGVEVTLTCPDVGSGFSVCVGLAKEISRVNDAGCMVQFTYTNGGYLTQLAYSTTTPYYAASSTTSFSSTDEFWPGAPIVIRLERLSDGTVNTYINNVKRHNSFVYNSGALLYPAIFSIGGNVVINNIKVSA